MGAFQTARAAGDGVVWKRRLEAVIPAKAGFGDGEHPSDRYASPDGRRLRSVIGRGSGSRGRCDHLCQQRQGCHQAPDHHVSQRRTARAFASKRPGRIVRGSADSAIGVRLRRGSADVCLTHLYLRGRASGVVQKRKKRPGPASSPAHGDGLIPLLSSFLACALTGLPGRNTDSPLNRPQHHRATSLLGVRNFLHAGREAVSRLGSFSLSGEKVA